MTQIHVMLLIMGVATAAIASILFLDSPPWKLLIWAGAITIIGSLYSVGMITDSQNFHDPGLGLVGQSLVVFISIIGGGMFSAGWSELRRSARRKVRLKKTHK